MAVIIDKIDAVALAEKLAASVDAGKISNALRDGVPVSAAKDSDGRGDQSVADIMASGELELKAAEEAVVPQDVKGNLDVQTKLPAAGRK